MNFTRTELMAIAAARMIAKSQAKTIFVGTGLPLLAATLAARLYMHDITLIYESGGISHAPKYLPISVADTRTYKGGFMTTTMDYVMSLAATGRVDLGLLGGAQIDQYGNLNTTVIGTWEKPTVRLPGSGGANEVGSLSNKVMIIMRQDKRKFVPKVDFITTPGWLSGGDSRNEVGLPRLSGPWMVITQLGLYDFNGRNKRMRLIAMMPGVTLEDIQANSGFEIEVSDKVGTVCDPTEEEVKILRDIDKYKILTGKED
ncbi:3-oxoadipate--succinyl-CoA transferase subunit B [Thermocladium modestius]|uniref:3-oxoadipate--succinyl-CoA transferase subunit B n=1 Tax=Thermocladium modestius TaxID=62609 RepID=A0A830GUE0_9CREN|nr:CoA-transferase [Thermocladium modestius]GGP20408.1 3-oxoadipate--succinyl-CoA transferase subunit B [Thermocladium modestius]